MTLSPEELKLVATLSATTRAKLDNLADAHPVAAQIHEILATAPRLLQNAEAQYQQLVARFRHLREKELPA